MANGGGRELAQHLMANGGGRELARHPINQRRRTGVGGSWWTPICKYGLLGMNRPKAKNRLHHGDRFFVVFFVVIFIDPANAWRLLAPAAKRNLSYTPSRMA
jgi:hypothetical protein